MRTLRLLVTVITRQPPRPVPLYFVDFASKPAWHAPFGFSHVFCQGSLAQSQTVRAKHFTPGMEALASDAIVKFSRFVTAIPFCGLNQIHCRKNDCHNLRSKPGSLTTNCQTISPIYFATLFLISPSAV